MKKTISEKTKIKLSLLSVIIFTITTTIGAGLFLKNHEILNDA
jgi:hypothetical protein